MLDDLKAAIAKLRKEECENLNVHGTPAPEGFRGKIQYNQQACVGCRTCEHVCAGDAIRIEEDPDGSGLHFLLWHNSCAFCGLCQHYCPTKAIRMTEDYHTAHLQKDKYDYVERGFIKYVPCAGCGRPMIPVAMELLALAYADTGELEYLAQLCEKCRPVSLLRRRE